MCVVILKEVCKRCRILFFNFYTVFKGYISLAVITKYWLYSPCCRIYSCSLFYTKWFIPLSLLPLFCPSLFPLSALVVLCICESAFFFSWSCSVACSVLVSWPEIEPATLAVRVLSPNHWTVREFPVSFLSCSLLLLLSRFSRVQLCVTP